MRPDHVLLLPGWHDSGSGHWQSRWELLHGYHRVVQHDGERPLRGDWSARLEEVVLSRPEPVLLVAHSLGCLLVAAWAAHSRLVGRVRAALLVAPADPERPELQALLRSWSPVDRQRLPFPALLVGSHNDPFCRFERAQGLAADWGAHFHDAGEAGHINADSDLRDWTEGHALLGELISE